MYTYVETPKNSIGDIWEEEFETIDEAIRRGERVSKADLEKIDQIYIAKTEEYMTGNYTPIKYIKK